MRSRYVLFALVAAVFVMPTAAQAGIPFLGPIIDKSWIDPATQTACALGWGALVIVINNIISLLITLAIVFVAPLMIAWAGFLMVLNPTKAGDLEKGKKILWNMVIGIVFALSGWLIVDAIMAVLYKPSPDSKWTTTWSQIVTGNLNEACIELKASLNQGGAGSSVTGVSAGGGRFLTPPTSGSCSPASLMAATAKSPYPLTQAQANTLSCIAVPESSCSNTPTGAKQSSGKPTSASGMFQIVFGCDGCNEPCHNLNIPTCSQAANVTGDLNCSQQFRGGKPKTDAAGNITAGAAACQRAAANLTCNAQAAACLVNARIKRGNGGFEDWTGTGDGYSHATQKNCVAQYANK